MDRKHLVSALSLEAAELKQLFAYALQVPETWDFRNIKNEAFKTLRGAHIACIFQEASTRTRMSFSCAIHALGATSESMDNAEKFSSASKGESLEDSIRVMSRYFDAIILRSPRAGDAERAARVASVPIINAGDGNHEHPTQALLDLYTIWKEVQTKRLPSHGLHVHFFGDNLHSRTVRSLAFLLAKHGPEVDVSVERVTFSGLPDTGRPPEDVSEALYRAGVGVDVVDDIPSGPDVLYVTRAQSERHAAREGEGVLVFDPALRVLLKAESIIMHPLPRTTELPIEIDQDERAWYFKQSANGVPIRMALLDMLLNPARR